MFELYVVVGCVYYVNNCSFVLCFADLLLKSLFNFFLIATILFSGIIFYVLTNCLQRYLLVQS